MRATGKLTRQQFLAKLDSLCKQSNQALSPYEDKASKLVKRVNSTTGEEQQSAENHLADVFRKAVTAFEPALERARIIQPPKSERAFFNTHMNASTA